MDVAAARIAETFTGQGDPDAVASGRLPELVVGILDEFGNEPAEHAERVLALAIGAA